MTADEVLEEFLLDPCCIDCPASDCINERRMADEIVRLRGELRDTHTKVFHLEEKLAWTERERDQLTSMPAERILDKLRKPSQTMVDAVFAAVIDWYPGAYNDRKSAEFSDEIVSGLQTAVAAAEQEVGNDTT